MEGVAEVGDPLGVLPVLFHLLWLRALETDLRFAPLSENSLEISSSACRCRRTG
jgi:hypothetical protein